MSITINGTTGVSGVDGSAGTPALQGGDTNTGIVFGTDTVGVSTGGVQRTTVDSSGRLLVGVGSANANGGILQLTSGITFPATAVAASDANTLDDYEEGTWTPIASRLSGGDITASYGDVNGKYTKIGRMVTISCYLQITSVTSQGSSAARISGLPFSPPASLTSAGAVFYNTAATTLVIGAAAPHATGHVYFHENTNNGNLASFNWQAGIISFTISYEL